MVVDRVKAAGGFMHYQATAPEKKKSAHNTGQLTNFVEEVSWIGHDLNGQLTALMAGISMLEHHVDPNGKIMLERVERALAQSVELAKSLVFRGRQRADLISLAPEQTNIRQVVRTTLSTYDYVDQPSLSVHFCKSIPESLWLPKSLLERIVGNLVCNAFKHTQAGTIRVFASYSPAHELFRLIVNDTGSGISNEKLEAIRAKTPVPDNIDHHEKGLGIGLWLVQHFLELAHGTFEISSGDGQGTTVIISIPATEG